MISWRSARLFLLCLTSMAVFVVMVAAVSDLNLSSLVALVSRPEAQLISAPVTGKAAPRPLVYPVVVIPKDAPSIFEEV